MQTKTEWLHYLQKKSTSLWQKDIAAHERTKKKKKKKRKECVFSACWEPMMYSMGYDTSVIKYHKTLQVRHSYMYLTDKTDTEYQLSQNHTVM